MPLHLKGGSPSHRNKQARTWLPFLMCRRNGIVYCLLPQLPFRHPAALVSFSTGRGTHFNAYPKTPKNLLTAEWELGRGPWHCKEDLAAWLLGQGVPWETATGFPRILPCSVGGSRFPSGE